ncbi:MAG TPA: IclR family transcriptional regulator [Enteractinococcus helveticum]|uniref:IclR family transcriptional regulator n=1 Tax=Enteractinococcus helveticum TaxID=1837282 RepID=A0A921FQ54_9MICC|nr:IclR family transcriptional regulator [Enteractinococcus helveticum]HJF15092.1 IclR family transcriptional regulator [Enteractinococcus helveticum]
MGVPDFLIESVDNALTVMDMVTERGEVRVRRVSEELEISPSSAHRLLATLAHRRYLVQDPTSKIYRPGAKLIDRRAPNADVLKLRRVLKSHMEHVATITQESVSLSLLMGEHIEFIDGVESPHTLRASPRVGAHLPAYATAGGKVQLAELSPQDLAALYPDGLKALTAHTVTDISELTKKLQQIGKHGYAVSREESTEGISAVSVPIQDAIGRILAALSVLAPSARLPDTKLQPIIELLRASAQAVKPLL